MQGNQHQRTHGIRLATTRAAVVIVSLEPEVNERFSKAVNLRHLACADQTVKFPVQSRPGNNYLLILCDCDENASLAELMPNRKIEILQEAKLNPLDQVNQKGHKHANMQLDNEKSEEYVSMLKN